MTPKRLREPPMTRNRPREPLTPPEGLWGPPIHPEALGTANASREALGPLMLPQWLPMTPERLCWPLMPPQWLWGCQ